MAAPRPPPARHSGVALTAPIPDLEALRALTALFKEQRNRKRLTLFRKMILGSDAWVSRERKLQFAASGRTSLLSVVVAFAVLRKVLVARPAGVWAGLERLLWKTGCYLTGVYVF